MDIGDVLWALMIFYIVRFLFINSRMGLLSLIICYSIEISQLYQADLINSIRNTLIGRLVLGQGFLWSDIIAYTVGIIIGTLSDRAILKRLAGDSAANQSNAT